MSPYPYSYRELEWMNKGKQQLEWDRTASLMALLIRLNCKGKTPSAEELNPYRTTKNKGIKKQMAMIDYIQEMTKAKKGS